MKMLHDKRWTVPAAYDLDAREKLVFQWLLGNKDTSISGVYEVRTGAIQDGVGYHIFDNNVKGSPVYPTLDKLVDVGVIDYDKPTHTLRIINYHKYRPFGNGRPLIVLQTLNNELEAVHNQNYFVDYIEENKDIILKKINDARLDYKKALEKKMLEKKSEKSLTNPDDLDFTKLALKTCGLYHKPDKPSFKIVPNESDLLIEKPIVSRQLANC